MAANVLGIHHATAISGAAQENIDFYTEVLGLRLVKVTVNYDDPSAYHLYYGDARGTPGTLLTFFPYPDGYPGRPGRGQATVATLNVPPGSLPAWSERFRENDVDFDRITNRMGASTIPFRAPDGLQLELAVSADARSEDVWTDATVPAEIAIFGMRGVTLAVADLAPTEAILVDVFGFRRAESRDSRHRYEAPTSGPGRFVDVLVDPQGPEGRPGHGSLHHVAFRASGEAEQLEIREEVSARGLPVTEVIDRTYFKSIYFREPGGVLFEVATDVPGFEVDETREELGRRLRLPKRLEARRGQIARSLPALKLPGDR